MYYLIKVNNRPVYYLLDSLQLSKKNEIWIPGIGFKAAVVIYTTFDKTRSEWILDKLKRKNSCNQSCSPGDWRKCGKCDFMQCYY